MAPNLAMANILGGFKCAMNNMAIFAGW